MLEIIMILALLFGGHKAPTVGGTDGSSPVKPAACTVQQGSDIGC
jgi:hypothetical protein